MGTSNWASASHAVNAITPVADFLAGTVNSDVIECLGEGILFFVHTGANAGGDSTITVQACDDTTPSNATAVNFIYRTTGNNDTWSAWTAAAAATGFTSSTTANTMYQVYVDAAELAAQGYGYARLRAVESTDAAVLGGCVAWVVNTRFQIEPTSLID